MNKYFKCVKQNTKEENFKIGTIYEMTKKENGEDSITCTDTYNGKGEPYTYNDENLLEWLKSWYEFEEVTYTDYILQEFVNERIAILLKDAVAVEYWGEKLISICKKNNITNIWKFNSSEEDYEMCKERYYIKNKTVYLDEDYDESYEDIVLKEIKNENKEENKEMNKKNLTNGMIVETRNGNLYLVHEKVLMNSNNYTMLNIEDYKEDLVIRGENKEFDIMKVYNSKARTLKNMFDENELELIWEREENEYLTKEYHLGDLHISPNSEDYNNEEEDPIYIAKSDDWDESSISITKGEAKFLIEALTEILNNTDK